MSVPKWTRLAKRRPDGDELGGAGASLAAGAFQKRFRNRGALPGSRIRCWLLWKCFNKFFGDQAIFVRRHALEQAGGMPAVPLMEEYELCKALEPHGHLVLAKKAAATTARKFRKEGTFQTYWRMASCHAHLLLGKSPHQLKKFYYPDKTVIHDAQDGKIYP